MTQIVVPSRFDILVNNDGTPTTLFAAYMEALTAKNNDLIDIVEPYYRSLAAISALRAEVEDLKIIHSVNLIPADNTLEKRISDLQEELFGFITIIVNQKDLTGFLKNLVEDITPQLGGALSTNGFNITMTGTETVDGRDVSIDGTKLDSIEIGATQDQTASNIRTLGFFDITNDGTGSGLDADLLDGNHSTAFATSAQGTLADSALQNIVEDTTPQLGGELDTQNVKIVNLAAPTSDNDAARKIYVDASDALLFPLAGGTVTGIYDGNNTTNSTGATNGSIHTDGGLGVVKDVHITGRVTILGGLITKGVNNQLRLFETDAADPNDEIQFARNFDALRISHFDSSMSANSEFFRSTASGTTVLSAGDATLGLTIAASTGDVTFANAIKIDSTTDSTSTTTGSIHTDGGLGVVKDITIGGAINFAVNQSFNADITIAYIQKQSNNGLLLRTVAGTAYDFFLSNPAGSHILRVPTGTRDIEIVGTLTNTNTTDSTSTTTGSIHTDGGLGVVKTIVAGTGIKLGGTSINNLLDLYQEAGTFTPTIIGTTTTGVGTYSHQEGKFTRIGNVVFFSLSMQWQAHTGAGSMRISGLPFTPITTKNGFPVSFGAQDLVWGTADTQAFVRVHPTAALLLLNFMDLTGGGTLEAQIDTAGRIFVNGTYFT